MRIVGTTIPSTSSFHHPYYWSPTIFGRTSSSTTCTTTILPRGRRRIHSVSYNTIHSHKWKLASTTKSIILSSCYYYYYYLCHHSSSTNSFLSTVSVAALMSSSASTTTSTNTYSTTSTAIQMTTNKPNMMIDSHLHVWGTNDDSLSKRYPYVQDPPTTLQDAATVSSLLQYMEYANIDGALIVQPINYLYDHSYVLHAMKEYPTKLKGMMIYNPTEFNEDHAIQRLEELVLAGMVGIRFNPYLFPKSSSSSSQQQEWGFMSEGIGLQIYQRCATLHIPVGIMCFQGLSLHYHDILQLLKVSPQTIMILDHFAFTKFSDDNNNNNTDDDMEFAQLLQLSKYPSVHVKISALFRMNDNHSSSSSSSSDGPYPRIYQERFLPLLQAYGSQRLLYGSDFPYILENPFPGGDNNNNNNNNDDQNVYTKTCQLVASWCPDVESRNAIMGGNAERLFGPWGTLPSISTSSSS